MPKDLIFFICACVIMFLTAINLSVGPIISKKVGTLSTSGKDWGTLNCEKKSDDYEEAKKTTPAKELKYDLEWKKDECYRKRAMYHLEYLSFIIDICIGFVCSLLMLLHLMAQKKDFIPKTGLIGFICGIAGFILTFVYVVYNGIVYTSYYDEVIYKKNRFGIYAQKNGNNHICFYHVEPANYRSLIAKYSDLIKRQYNYDKDLIKSYQAIDNDDLVSGCKRVNPIDCVNGKEWQIAYEYQHCGYLYSWDPLSQDFKNKDKSQRFLTALILSLFVCFAHIGLAIFGFLLFKSPSNDPFLSKFETVQNQI